MHTNSVLQGERSDAQAALDATRADLAAMRKAGSQITADVRRSEEQLAVQTRLSKLAEARAAAAEATAASEGAVRSGLQEDVARVQQLLQDEAAAGAALAAQHRELERTSNETATKLQVRSALRLMILPALVKCDRCVRGGGGGGRHCTALRKMPLQNIWSPS